MRMCLVGKGLVHQSLEGIGDQEGSLQCTSPRQDRKSPRTSQHRTYIATARPNARPSRGGIWRLPFTEVDAAIGNWKRDTDHHSGSAVRRTSVGLAVLA